jgi:hypothetical protein
MIARILILMAFLIVAAPDAHAGATGIALFQCSFVRTQWFQGQCRVTKGHFLFDAERRCACYDYNGPFRYRFIVNDTAIVGIDKKNNVGYALSRAADPQQYDNLLGSVHLFGQFLGGIAVPAGDDTGVVRGSVDSCVYVERKTDRGSDVIARSRETGLPLLIESLDETGAMVEQSRMVYGRRHGTGATMPSKVIVRRKWAGVILVDTLALSAVRTNTESAPDAFAVPHECRLGTLGDLRGRQETPFSFTGKRK